MKKPVLIITLFLAVMNATSQVAINTNNTNPAPSAMLDVKSDSKGMLIPRMNSTQRKAISNPDVGLMVYDTDRQTIYLFDGFQWKPMMVTIDTQLPLISRGPESGATTIGFGMSVDIHGDYAIVGAPYDTAMGTAPGTAYIFAKENGTWTQQARIYPSNGTAGDNFGASVAIYGDYVVVGAPEKDISGVNRRGRAYIFKRNNRYWEQVAGLQASNGAAEDKFGSAVSVSDQYIVVGAPYKDHSGKTDAGSAYVFALSNGNWIQKSIFNPSDPAEDGRFGFAVGVSGNTAVISAPNATVQGTAKVGALYTFNCQDFNGDTWIAGQKLEPIFVQAFMGFGFSLVIEGNTIFTGAPFFDFQGINGTGLTQSFKRTNGVWSKAMHGEYTIPNAQTGMSVALNGADYWYGSPGWDTDKGRVKVGNFNHVYDTDPDLQRHFGRNMAAHNGQFIIAAPGGPHGTVFFGIRD